jgi:hypothetical protein
MVASSSLHNHLLSLFCSDPPPDSLVFPWVYLSLLLIALVIATIIAVISALVATKRSGLAVLRSL